MVFALAGCVVSAADAQEPVRVLVGAGTVDREGAVRVADLDAALDVVRARRAEEAAGIIADGGARASLTLGGLVAEDCESTRFGPPEPTYRPAVELSGVGHRGGHDRIHEALPVAVLAAGNEHVVEQSEIFRVLLETGDCGAIDIGRDWAMHGVDDLLPWATRSAAYEMQESTRTRCRHAVALRVPSTDLRGTTTRRSSERRPRRGAGSTPPR